MPKSSNHLALARQWEMLKKIPARAPGITANELTSWLKDQGFAVSKRTVERDLNELSALFGIMRNDVSIPYGWHWMPGKQYEFSSVELTDAVSLKIAEDILRKLLPSKMLLALEAKFEQARDKLNALKDEHPYANWSDKVRYLPTTMNLLPPNISEACLTAVQQAVLEGMQIEVHYASFNRSEVSVQALHPLGLVLKGNTPYLVATAFDYEDVRLYAIHRMQKVRVLSARLNTPDGFSVDKYISDGAMEFGGGEKITLKATLSNELAMYLTETPMVADQKITHRDGQWQITAKLRDTLQLHFWIMSQGASITVNSPRKLRLRIGDCHRNAANAYDRCN
jgi:predicted DNA-binding transcriptional regulator YafY